EGDDGRGEFVRTLLGQEVAAAVSNGAALDMVAERRDRRTEGVADAVLSAERQHRHRQPMRGARLGLAEPLRAERGAVPLEAGSGCARLGKDANVLVDGGR